ncbi:MAG: superinfection exclusion B family protein [Parcubacteria group bacterium]|nr:superinfection exclusion B family protein [Parcubacteria group bacterium]
MLEKIKTTWFYAKLSLTSMLEVWWFFATLACGAGLGFSGEHIYANLGSKAAVVVWNPWILATCGFSLMLALILCWGFVLRHIRTKRLIKAMKNEIQGLKSKSTEEKPELRRNFYAEYEQKYLPQLPPEESMRAIAPTVLFKKYPVSWKTRMLELWDAVNPDKNRFDR